MIGIKKILNNKIDERLLLLVIFIIPLVVFLWRLEDNYMLLLSDDEFCQWANAARLNGQDWSDICINKPYYSYFYSFFLAFFYRVFDSSARMYQAAVVFNSILLASISNISYRICKKIDTQERPLLWAVIGLACTLNAANVVNSNLTWTEAFLTFITWMIYLMAVEISASDKGYLLKTVVFICLLMIGYMTHQRFLGGLIAGILFIIFSLIQRGVNVKRIGIVALTFAVIVAVHGIIKHDLQNELYLVAQRESIGNDYSSVTRNVKAVLSFSGVIRTLKMMCGHIMYEGVASLLIGFLGIFEIVRRFILSAREKVTSKSILYFFLFCITVFSLGVGVIFMNYPGRLDTIVYGRYAENTYGILLLMGLMRIANVEISDRDFLIPSLALASFAIIVNPFVTPLNYEGSIFQHFCAPGISYYWYKGHDFLQTSLIVISVFATIFIAKLVIKRFHFKYEKTLIALMASVIVMVVSVLNGMGINEDIVLPLKNQYAGNYLELYGEGGSIGQDKELVYLYYDNIGESNVNEDIRENGMWLSFLQFCLKDKRLGFRKVSIDEINNISNLNELGDADYIVGAVHNEYLGKFDFEYGGNKFIHLKDSEHDNESALNLDMFYSAGSRQENGLISDGTEHQAILFGPYIKMEKGNYVVHIYMEAESLDELKIEADVSGNKGLTIFSEYAVSEQDFKDEKADITIPFSMEEDCTNVEIRVFTDNVIKVTGVSLAEQ